MKRPHNDIDGLLYRALHEMEVPASPGDWEMISRDLKKETGKRGISRGIVLSALLLLLSAAGVAAWVWNHASKNMAEKNWMPGLAESINHKTEFPQNADKRGLPGSSAFLSATNTTSDKNPANQGKKKAVRNFTTKSANNTNQEAANSAGTSKKTYLERIAGIRDNSLSPILNPLGTGWLSSHLNPQTNRHAGRWKIGVSFSQYSSDADYALNPKNLASTHKDYLERINASTGSRTYRSLGVEAGYNIGKNITIASGFAYEIQSEKMSYNFVNTEVPVIDSQTGRILGYVILNDSVQTRYQGINTVSYITLPISIQKEIPFAAKWSASIALGGRLQMLIGANGMTLDPTSLELMPVSKAAMNQFNAGYSVSAGINYYVGPLLSLGLQPGYERLIYANFKPGQPLIMHDSRKGITATAKLSIF